MLGFSGYGHGAPDPPPLRVQAKSAGRRIQEILPPIMAGLVAEELDFMSSSGWIGDEARLRALIAEVYELDRKVA